MTEVLDAPASTELAIIQTGVAELDPTATALAELQHRLKGIAYPALNTGSGMQQALDDRRTLIDLRVGLGKLAEQANKQDRADTKARCEKRDTGAEKLTTAIKALEVPIDEQIKAEEKRKADAKAERERIETERKAKHEAGIARIRAFAVKATEDGMTAERIATGIAMVEAMKFTSEHWEEFAVPAANAQCETIQTMKVLHAAALAAEAKAAEDERVRKENEELRARLAALEAERPPHVQEAQEAHQQEAGDPPAGADRAGGGEQPTVAANYVRVDPPPGHVEPAAVLAVYPPNAPAFTTFTFDHSLMSKSGPADEKPTLKLGDINDWFAGVVTTSAAGLALLGITHSGTDKAAKLYLPSDKARIKAALIRHLEGLSV